MKGNATGKYKRHELAEMDRKKLQKKILPKETLMQKLKKRKPSLNIYGQ